MRKLVLTDYGKKLNDFLDDKMPDGKLSNDDLVQFILTVGQYLGLETISNHAKRVGKTYNGVLKSNIEIVELFGIKFVIDNQ